MAMHITGIHIYPVKGTRAVSLERAEVRRRGLAGDRRWLVVDQSGKFLTQRSHPKLALVSASVHTDGSIELDAPGMPHLRVAIPDAGERQSVTVWDDTFEAAVGPPEAARWFSHCLGLICGLAYMDQATRRPVAPTYGQPGDVVSFADAVPLLLATDASLSDLNRRLTRPVPMLRFRPNVTVDGHEPWEEDRWKIVRMGNVEFEVTHRCARCVVTTIDQDTGEKSGEGEPLKTLATFRRDADGVYFGQNLVPRGAGTIAIGDEVEVLRMD
jgi:hypothetical protein